MPVATNYHTKVEVDVEKGQTKLVESFTKKNHDPDLADIFGSGNLVKRPIRNRAKTSKFGANQIWIKQNPNRSDKSELLHFEILYLLEEHILEQNQDEGLTFTQDSKKKEVQKQAS